MKVLSLFDGMACGMVAMLKQGAEVERYVAYEIDKYAIQTSSHNFPMIEHRGDVFKADFTEFEGFDYLIGGSPCTYWSIAQKNNRETEASGMGWELFSQYVRALREAKPKYFIYENNKSMSKAIRESIDDAFGFEAVLINSALVSAQNRQRLYWVGKRNEDGTYSRVNIEQPEDKGIVLRDILETGVDLTSNEKSYVLTASYNGAVAWNTIERSQRTMVAEPVNVTADGKSQVLKANYHKSSVANFFNGEGGMKYSATGVCEPIRIGDIGSTAQAHRVYSCDGKSVTLSANGGGQGGKTGLYATPYELSDEYFKGGEDSSLIGMTANGEGKYRNGSQPSQQYRVYSCEGKSQVVNTLGNENYIVPHENVGECETIQKAIPKNDNIIAPANKQDKPIYEVKDGLITIKGKQYPIKLADGFYIIRKLTVRECMRLQTVPEWYEFPVSNSQAYKMLGNGWTVDVIAHILKGVNKNENRNT